MNKNNPITNNNSNLQPVEHQPPMAHPSPAHSHSAEGPQAPRGRAAGDQAV